MIEERVEGKDVAASRRGGKLERWWGRDVRRPRRGVEGEEGSSISLGGCVRRVG